MREKNKIAWISILTALIALIILLLSVSYAISSTTGRAGVENIIEPLDVVSSGTPGGVTYHISDIDDDDDDDDDDHDPVISGLPDINLGFGSVFNLDLDFYASDDEDSNSDLDFTVIYTPVFTPAPITINIDGSSHIGKEVYDNKRTAYLNNLGLKILRFKNEQILNDDCSEIRDLIMSYPDINIKGLPLHLTYGKAKY